MGEAGPIFRETGDMQALVWVLVLAAVLAVAEADHERAARLSGAADAVKEPLGEVATPLQVIGMLEDPAEAARAALGDEAFEAAYRLGRAMSLNEMIDAVRH